MRKIYILLFTLLVATQIFASSNIIEIEKSNNANVEFFTTGGEKIDKITSSGQIINTNNNEVVMSTSIGNIVLSPNTIMELSQISPEMEFYLITGEASFNLEKDLLTPIRVKTPTTRTEISGKGESLFISNEKEEKFYNFSQREAKAYNMITGKEREIALLDSIDFLKNNDDLSSLTREEYNTRSKTKLLKFSPNAPKLYVSRRDLVTIEEYFEYEGPDAPHFAAIDRTLWPIERTFSISNHDFTIIANNSELSIFYPDEYKIDEILSSLEAFINLDSDIEDVNPIHFEYTKTMNQEQINKLISLIEKALIEKLTKGEYISDVVMIPTDKGSFSFEAIDGNINITLPVGTEVNANAFAKNLSERSSIEFVPQDQKLQATYPIGFTIQDLRALEDNIALTVKDMGKEKEEKEESTQIKASITSQTKTRAFSFDLRFNTRVFTDSSTNQVIETSILPEFSYGTFKLSLNLNPFSIMEYKTNEDYIDWLGYGFDFIESLQYRTMNEVFSLTIDKTSTLDGDALSLYGGHNHLWDKSYRPLTLSMDVNLKHFDFRLFYSDLTLGKFAFSSDALAKNNVGGIDMKYIISETYPMSLSIGLLTQTDVKNAKNTQLYPEATLYLPFYSKGHNDVGLMFAFSSKMDITTETYNPLESGFLLSASIPMEFSDFKANIGIYYSNLGTKTTSGPLLHYKGISNPSFKPTESDSNLLTLLTELGYNGKHFGFETSILGDVNTNTMTFKSDNTLLDASTYLSFAGVTLRAGFSMQEFTAASLYKENAKIYSGLDLDIGGVSTYFRLGIESLMKKDFFIAYGATASFMGKNEDRTDNPVKIPFSFEISTGYEYGFEDKSAKFIINPAMTIGKDNYAVSLRAPFQLFFDDSGKLGLGGWGGRKWWNFGLGETDGDRKILLAITDSLQLINFIKIANPEESVAYINASRDYLRNDTLFTAFGSANALSLLTGFNFRNLSLEVYGGNIEDPHIGDLRIGVYPIDLDSFSVNISVSSEFYIKDMKNFNLFFYPEVRFNVPLFWNHFDLAVYAVGSISTEYIEGQPTNTKVIFDFASKKFYSSMAGVEMGLKWTSFSTTVQTGWRNGALTPDMYNVFTSTYNLTPSFDDAGETSSFFAKATMDVKMDAFQLELAYSANDIVELVKNYKSIDDDIFSLKTKVYFNKSINMYGSFHKKGFASLFQSGVDFKKDVFKSSTSIYSIGMGFDYGIVSINAEYSSALFSNGYLESSFINVNPRYTRDDISSSFSVTTRIKF